MKVLRKEEQDPIWTSKGKENGAKCRNPEGTPGFSAAAFVGKGGGRSQRLRAFRMSSKRNVEEEKRGTHGKAMAAGSEASAKSISASRPAAASAAGHEEVVAVNVARLAEDLQMRLQIIEIGRKRQDQWQSIILQEAFRMRRSKRLSSRSQRCCLRKRWQLAGVFTQWERIWGWCYTMDIEALCSSSRAICLWQVTSGMRSCGRVMVAWHEEVMESCANRLSIDVKQLHLQRTTVIFDSRGRQVVQDDWMSPKANTLSQVVERWRGYTFFGSSWRDKQIGTFPSESNDLCPPAFKRHKGSARSTGLRNPRGSSISGRWNWGTSKFFEGYGNKVWRRHADEEAAEYERDGSFEKADGSWVNLSAKSVIPFGMDVWGLKKFCGNHSPKGGVRRVKATCHSGHAWSYWILPATYRRPILLETKWKRFLCGQACSVRINSALGCGWKPQGEGEWQTLFFTHVSKLRDRC